MPEGRDVEVPRPDPDLEIKPGAVPRLPLEGNADPAAVQQQRGHILMGAGHSIAVQNFNENLSILVMLGVYSLLIKFNFSIYTVIVLFGVFVAVAMTLVRERHYLNLHRGAMPQIPRDPGH